jgi:hypothetical protein
MKILNKYSQKRNYAASVYSSCVALFYRKRLPQQNGDRRKRDLHAFKFPVPVPVPVQFRAPSSDISPPLLPLGDM